MPQAKKDIQIKPIGKLDQSSKADKPSDRLKNGERRLSLIAFSCDLNTQSSSKLEDESSAQQAKYLKIGIN